MSTAATPSFSPVGFTNRGLVWGFDIAASIARINRIRAKCSSDSKTFAGRFRQKCSKATKSEFPFEVRPAKPAHEKIDNELPSKTGTAERLKKSLRIPTASQKKQAPRGEPLPEYRRKPATGRLGPMERRADVPARP